MPDEVVVENEEEAEKAFMAGGEGNDDYKPLEEPAKAEPEKPDLEPAEEKPAEDDPSDKAIDKVDDKNIDEWEGIDAPIKAKFEAMEKDLKDAQHIARTANGRASKLQSQADKVKPVEKPKITSEQIHAAMSDPEKLNEMEKEGDWDEMVAVIKEVKASLAKGVGGEIDRVRNELRQENAKTTDEAVQTAISRMQLDNSHAGWENDINTKEFKDFLYEGGPNKQEVDNYDYLLQQGKQTPAKAADADHYYSGLIDKYPLWARDKGNLYGSPSTESAIKLLDLYKGGAKVQKNSSKKKMLEDNIAPTDGSGVKPPPAASVGANQAFLEGANEI